MRRFYNLLFALLALSGTVSAHVVQVGDVYYDIDGPTLTAEVSYRVYEYYSGDITVPGTFRHNGYTYKVTEIGGHAFSSCKKLTSVTILEGPTYIGSSAFNQCTGLRYISLPNSITDIKDGAFYGCSNLERIYVPRGQKSRFASMSALRGLTDKLVER